MQRKTCLILFLAIASKQLKFDQDQYEDDSFAGNVVEENTVAEAGIAAGAAEEEEWGAVVDDAVSDDRTVTMDCSCMDKMVDVEGSSADHVEDSQVHLHRIHDLVWSSVIRYQSQS